VRDRNYNINNASAQMNSSSNVRGL